MEKSKEKNKEGLKNNINREEQSETVKKEKNPKKEKYGEGDSHINDDENTEQEEKGKQKPDTEHDDANPEGVHLNRKSKKEQEVEIGSKSHLDEDEG